MVKISVNHNNRQSERYSAVRDYFGPKLIAFLLLLTGVLLALTSKSLRGGQSGPVSASSAQSMHVAQVDIDIIEGEVSVDIDQKEEQIAYFHCGPRHTPSYGKKTGHGELLLLHGARFTKDDWKTSGIMKSLCKDSKKRPGLSVTAIDLSVSANGAALLNVFDALVREKVLSGDPIVIVTPSASGKAMLTLSEADDVKNGSRSIKDVVAMWVPVACGGILKADEEAMAIFADISVLAIYGSEDPVAGGQSSQKLVELVVTVREWCIIEVSAKYHGIRRSFDVVGHLFCLLCSDWVGTLDLLDHLHGARFHFICIPLFIGKNSVIISS